MLCEAQNWVVTGGVTAFNYTCAKHRIALSLVKQRLSITLSVRSNELRYNWWCNGFQLNLCESQNCVITGVATAINYTCAKQRIALSLMEQRHSITHIMRNSVLRFHWWSNGIQLQLLCETQDCVVIGGVTAFNYRCVKQRIALSLVELKLSITDVRNTQLRCHCCCNGFKFHLLCEAQNCVYTGVPTAFKYTCCAKHCIALSIVQQSFQLLLLC